MLTARCPLDVQVSFYKQYRDILISDIIHVVSVAACTTAVCSSMYYCCVCDTCSACRD